jgi:hypothetical protein
LLLEAMLGAGAADFCGGELLGGVSATSSLAGGFLRRLRLFSGLGGCGLALGLGGLGMAIFGFGASASFGSGGSSTGAGGFGAAFGGGGGAGSGSGASSTIMAAGGSSMAWGTDQLSVSTTATTCTPSTMARLPP